MSFRLVQNDIVRTWIILCNLWFWMRVGRLTIANHKLYNILHFPTVCMYITLLFGLLSGRSFMNNDRFLLHDLIGPTYSMIRAYTIYKISASNAGQLRTPGRPVCHAARRDMRKLQKWRPSCCPTSMTTYSPQLQL